MRKQGSAASGPAPDVAGSRTGGGCHQELNLKDEEWRIDC